MYVLYFYLFDSIDGTERSTRSLLQLRDIHKKRYLANITSSHRMSLSRL